MNDYEPGTTTPVNDVALADHTFMRPITGRMARLRVFRRLGGRAATAPPGQTDDALVRRSGSLSR